MTDDIKTVLLDAIREGRPFGDLVREAHAAHVDEVSVLHDGCYGDDDTWHAALAAQPYCVIAASGYAEGYGEHSFNVVVAFADGRIAHAECGGCSCEGNGSWSYCENLTEALRLIPEDERPWEWFL